MKKRNSDRLTPAQQAEIEALAALPDDHIHTRDMPEVRDWRGARRGVFFRPVKQQLTLRIDADLIARADNLKVIGRAGVGVDNVDVAAATRRGVIVANAPQSNIITAAEHTMALLLALASPEI